VDDDALKSTTVATSPYVRELEKGEHELRLTGAPRPFDNDSRSRKRARARGAASLREDPLSHALVELAVRPDPAAIVLVGRAQPLALARGSTSALRGDPTT
jgi:hypothetical protein